MRLDTTDLILAHEPTLHAVRLRSAVQLGEGRALGFRTRDDEDAALEHGNRVLATIRTQLATALDAILRLETTGLEVVAGVNDAAVPATLVLGRPRFLFEHRNAHARARQVQRRAGADGARTDHDDVRRQVSGRRERGPRTGWLTPH